MYFIVLMLISLVCLVYMFIITVFTISKKHVSDYNYTVLEIPKFLSQEECEALIELSKDRLEPSKVYHGDTDNLDNTHRKSVQCWLDNKVHHLVQSISHRSASITETPSHFQEELQVVKYTTGGFFNPHYDPCHGAPEFCERLNGNNGPRYITVLIYLNDNFTGGETVFPRIGKTVVPEQGKAIVFYSTTPDGSVISESFHGGNPVISGEKWIANKWIHLY
jgi:prolyl 4-hydroxylase